MHRACVRNNIIEFYAHAIPYLASTREKTFQSGEEIVSVEFPGLGDSESEVNYKYQIEEFPCIPRGPDV